MPASTRVILILDKPIIFPAFAGDGHIKTILCNAVLDQSSQFAGAIEAIDLGASFGDPTDPGYRLCIPISNIIGYAYETVEGAFDGVAALAEAGDPGFYDTSIL